MGGCQDQEQQNNVPALSASPHLDEKRRRPRSLGDRSSFYQAPASRVGSVRLRVSVSLIQIPRALANANGALGLIF